MHERAVASSKRGNRGVPAAASDNSTAADSVSSAPSTAEASAAKTSSGGRGDCNGNGNSHKRLRVTPKSDEKSREMLNAMTSAGLFDPQAMFDSEEEGEQARTPAEEAKEAVSAWRTAKVKKACWLIIVGYRSTFWRDPSWENTQHNPFMKITLVSFFRRKDLTAWLRCLSLTHH